MLGQKGDYYRTKFKIEPLNINNPDIIPYTENQLAHESIPNPEEVENKAVVIRNPSTREFRFQLSFDNQHWQDFYLKSEHSGKYLFEEGQFIYLRYREKNHKYIVYKIRTGNAYIFYWDDRKKRWGLQG